MFGAGPMYLRVEEPKHDWSDAMEEWMLRQRDRLLQEESDDDEVEEEEDQEGWRTQLGIASGAAWGRGSTIDQGRRGTRSEV